MAGDFPLWMDNNFFCRILEEDRQQKVKILNFDVKPAVNPGYNYTSTVLRVKVYYLLESLEDKQNVSLIVKVPLDQGLFVKINEEKDFFGKEPITYQQFLPFIFKKIKSNLGPRGYISPVKDVMVMQDLKEEGFVMVKSIKQLDYEHCVKVMETVAKFHACSVKCFKENPKLIESVGEENLWVKATAVEKWMNEGTKLVVDVAKEINGDQRFIDYLSSRLDFYYDGIAEINQPKQNGFNVLNHGDLWANNLMFKHDISGKVLDVKFVDFQITRWASPVVDLTYVIWTSACQEVRENRLDDLFKVYLRSLNSTLELLGCAERLSWEELEQELTSAKDWGLVMICLCLPLNTQPDDALLDLSKFNQQDFQTHEFQSIYRSKNYLSLLPALLKNYSDFFLKQ